MTAAPLHPSLCAGLATNGGETVTGGGTLEEAVKARLSGLLAALLCVAGCSGTKVDVLTNFEPGYDFSNRRTYKWLDVKPAEIFPPETQDPADLDARIKAAVERELADKDFRRAEEADYVLRYGIQASERILSDPKPSTTSWDPSKDPKKYAQAALVLDFLDAKSNDRVWRGAALTDFRIGEARKQVDAVVIRILDEFPPKK